MSLYKAKVELSMVTRLIWDSHTLVFSLITMIMSELTQILKKRQIVKEKEIERIANIYC